MGITKPVIKFLLTKQLFKISYNTLYNGLSLIIMMIFRCGETRKQRANREVTETVFASEVHSVRRNPTKSILDYDSPKSNRSNRIINYDSILNSNNVEYTVPKSITDLDYGLPKSCIDYQSNHNTPARSMAIVSDGEVVVFDDIDDNWQGLRLDLASNTNQITTTSVDLETDDSQRGRIAPEPPSSSVGSTPSPTTAYHRNTSEFFKVIMCNKYSILHY